MLLYSITIVSKVSIIRTLIKALSLIGLFLFEGGSAQFAGGFIISISSMVPGGFYLASFAMMGFLRRVLNYLSSTWNDFWYRNRSWCNRICVVIPKGMIFPRPYTPTTTRPIPQALIVIERGVQALESRKNQ